MIKAKKFITILAVFMLSSALLAGCGTTEKEDTQYGGNYGVEENGEFEGHYGGEENGEFEGHSGQEIENKDTDQNEDQSQALTTADGTLKAADAEAGTVTITTQDGDELVLKATDKSKVQIDGSLSTFVQLTDKIGSEVSVEYQAETQNVTNIHIKD